MTYHQYQSFLDAINHCALECQASAETQSTDLIEYASLCRDCADLCWICAATLMNRGPRFVALIAQACADLADVCARECEKYSDDRLQKCAIACEQVVFEYRQIAGFLFLQEKSKVSPSRQNSSRCFAAALGN
ncbi:four-helix bundle copper-binding protein [Trichocoleus sp. FACHB-262]|uniref:four-helix bundle copper-binding protein n=1 Tax=Trichocoleus sp. FACHB-262 TaxID=2692869 RepID=UPI0016881318|nr:four-helix bundle copper-binding protein [Trichocoleus sp. FACHB-262]MBD2119591.1 four-helix bundle copper-binding protein [Trichocoleus sp. FACHB-262]